MTDMPSPIALLNSALSQVVALGASDLHIAADKPPMVRVSGALRPLTNVGVWSGAMVDIILAAAMKPDQLEQFGRELELDFA